MQMQKLSVKEAGKLVFKRGATNEVVIEASKLKVGEALVFSADSWSMKTAPGAYLGQTFRNSRSDKKFSVRKMFDGSFAVLRIK